MMDSEQALLKQMEDIKTKLTKYGYAVSVTAPTATKVVTSKSTIKKTAQQASNSPLADMLDSDALRWPLVLTGLYVLSLQRWAVGMQEESEATGVTNFNVWNSPPAVFSVLYLCMVYFGKRFMKDREPYSLKGAMLCYNGYQVILNAYGLCAFIMEAWGKPLWGQSIDRSSAGFNVAFLVWIHYNNKYVELADTVFMVFRKKNKQVSFLHVYHHVLLIWSWFAVCKYFPGGEAYFGAAANSFIHVLMYSYYLMVSLGFACPWKRYLTLCQQLQFVVCFAHAITVMVRGLVPVWLCLLQMWVMSNMLILFTMFYMKAYAKKKEPKLENKSD